jgi:hypothetical protein
LRGFLAQQLQTNNATSLILRGGGRRKDDNETRACANFSEHVYTNNQISAGNIGSQREMKVILVDLTISRDFTVEIGAH